MTFDWKADLTKEKNLWEVYLASTKLRKSKFNNYAYLVIGTIIGYISTNFIIFGESESAFNAVVASADVGFDLSAQILGFLIGGFAIFATVTDHRLMIAIAKAPLKPQKEGDAEYTVFKNIFLNFLSVFCIFLATLAISSFVKIASQVKCGSVTAPWGDLCTSNTALYINSIAFFASSGCVAFSILRLKSFIWNIYQAFITLLATANALDEAADRKD